MRGLGHFLLFFSVCVSNTNASSDVKRVIGTFPTLSTGSCSRESYFKNLCPPRSNFDMPMLCDYQCELGYQPQCITVESGSVYICLSSNLTCPPGVRWLPFLTYNNLTHVTIMQEECPAGYFQSTNSNCFDACKDKHKDTSNLPEELLIYSMGDEKSPTMVYCNFKENYFNAHGDFLIDLNSFLEHDRHFCSNIKDLKNQCPENMQILPNGKCVTPCAEGSEIDVYANFTCTTSIVPIKVTSPSTRTPQTSTITNSPKTSTTTGPDNKDKVQTDEVDTSAAKDSVVHTSIGGGVGAFILVVLLLALPIIIYCYCKNSQKGGPAINKEDRQLETCPEREIPSRVSSNESDRESVVNAPSCTVHNETYAEHVINIEEHSSVYIHHHYPSSSSSANQSADHETLSTEDDNTDGRKKGQNVKPIVRFSNDEDDAVYWNSTDGTETTPLVRKIKIKKLTASPYGSVDDEDPANGAIDSNVNEPLLENFETYDSRNYDEENTELKTVLTDPTYLRSFNSLTEPKYSESINNVNDETQRKIFYTEINTSSGDENRNNDILSILDNKLDLNTTEMKSLYQEHEMSLLKEIILDDESADTTSVLTDIGANNRTANLKESHDFCDDSINTEDKTKLKELLGPNHTERYGLEPACNFPLHLPANTENTEGMEIVKEYDRNLGHTRLFSNSLSGSDRSSVDKVASYIVHNETHAENLVRTGENCNVHEHLHNTCSSFFANLSGNQENQLTEGDNTDGQEVAQNVKPIVRFSKNEDEDDDLDSKSTDGTENTALLISECEKTIIKKLTASPYGSVDDEDPANGTIDSNVTEPLLATLKTNDSGSNDEGSTELKTVLTYPANSGSLISPTSPKYSESVNNLNDETQRKILYTDINTSFGDKNRNYDISSIRDNNLNLNTTEMKSLHQEHEMYLLKEITLDDESSESVGADRTSVLTDIGANDRTVNFCDDSMNTEDKTKLKELSGLNHTKRYGLEPAYNFPLHLSANTENTEGMEIVKEYDGNLGHTRLISNSLSGSDRSSVDKAASYIVHNETHAENLVRTGENCNVHEHFHNACSSFSANQSSNQEHHSTEDDNTDGQEVAQNLKPIVRFSNNEDEYDNLDSKRTDGTETTALLFSEGEKTTLIKKRTASPYGSVDDEDPAKGTIDSNVSEPLLATFETNDSGNNGEENTELTAILTDPADSGSLISLTDRKYSESVNRENDETQRKILNTDIITSSGDENRNNDISSIRDNRLNLNTTEMKSLYQENDMSLLTEITLDDESSDSVSADTTSVLTDIGTNDRTANLKDSYDFCDDSMNTEDNTILKEILGPNHIVNTENTESMEMLKEYDGNLVYTKLISNSLSDECLSVSSKSLEGQVSSRSSAG